jgi:DNA-directed RNA polymerase subunit beta'
MIKGKQGRFRENLLGKRVDYSARSVIVVGPELKLHQCGLPKKIALELYQPFIIRKLKEHGLADTIKSAKRMLERRDAGGVGHPRRGDLPAPGAAQPRPDAAPHGHPGLRAGAGRGQRDPIHPLVCTGFNADFDGDQMAVHLPLSVEAQAEAHVLMLSTHNIFSPGQRRADHVAVAGHRDGRVLHHRLHGRRTKIDREELPALQGPARGDAGVRHGKIDCTSGSWSA